LKPIAVTTDKAQNDTTGIADACKIFMELQDELLLQPHKDVEAVIAFDAEAVPFPAFFVNLKQLK